MSEPRLAVAGARKQAGFALLDTPAGQFLYDTASNAIVGIPGAVARVLESAGDAESESRRPARPGCADEPDAETSVAGGCEWLAAARARGMLQPFFDKDFDWVAGLDPAAELSSGLKGLTLGLTEQCNFRCAYCTYSGHYPGHRTYTPRRMSLQVALACVDFFERRAAPGAHFALYGGEPSLEWRTLEAVVRQIRRTGGPLRAAPIGLMTNGSLLTGRRIDFLIAQDVSLVVSLDGPPAVHDRFRRTARDGPTHGRVLRALERIHDRDAQWYGRNVSINCVVSTTREDELLALDRYFAGHALLRHLPITAIGLQPGMDCAHAGTIGLGRRRNWSPLWMSERFLGALTATAGRDAAERGAGGVLGAWMRSIFDVLAARTVGFAARRNWPIGMCYPGKQRLFVGADGRFFVCHLLDIEDAAIGDIASGFDHHRVRALVERWVGYCKRHCQRCWAYRLCSLCPAHAKAGGSLSDERLAARCERERTQCSEKLRAFAYIWRREEERGLETHPASLHALVRSVRGARSRARG